MQNVCVPSQQFDQYVPYRVNATSDRLGWRGFRVEVVRGHAPGEIALPALDHHLLNMIVSTRTRHEHRWDGLAGEATATEGAISLVPAGRESYWRWKYLSPEPACDFHIHLHPAFVRQVAVDNLTELSGDVDLRGELCFYHPEMRVLAEALTRETEAGGPHGSLYAESLATALVSLLLNRQRPSHRRLLSAPGRRPLRQLKAVCDYINAHLGDDLHLETLSRIAGLGPERLRESFRSHLGRSPHQYVTRQRLDRARDLLRSTSLPITEIALRLGFADHSHFTSTFRRELGVTPSHFRLDA